MSPNQLIVFTRYPETGKTKTRLVSALGEEGAASLQKEMTEFTLNWAKPLRKNHPVSLRVHYDGGTPLLMQAWLGNDLSYHPQGEGDLGLRMAEAFRISFQSGATRTVLIGTDCPDLSSQHVLKAFEALDENDLVLGPTADGGYCLIGMRRETPPVFKAISWGTPEVLEQTHRIARTLGLRVLFLDPVQDVDRPEDLHVWQKALRNYPAIRIVIPALNEEEAIAGCLSSTRESFRVKVTVVDGGSSDRTTAIARSFGARVLTSSPGRGRQMNLGARTAREQILLFLHADTRLPEGFDAMVREILARPETAGGAFRLSLEESRHGLKVIEGLANWRSRCLQFPYGDQAFFVHAKLFHHIGGFPEMPIMEDFEFIRRLRRKGRIVTAPSSVVSSARRWLRLGILRTTLVNQMMILGYYAGVSPARLARWYRRCEAGSPQRRRDR